MFRASLCPSSGEQECALPHMVFCTGCDGCGCVELRRELWALWKSNSNNPPSPVGFSFTRVLDNTRHTTVGRTPLDEWSARRRDLYLTTYTTEKRPCPQWESNLESQPYVPDNTRYWQQTHPWHRWDSNPQSQQASGRRPRSYWDRPQLSFTLYCYISLMRNCVNYCSFLWQWLFGTPVSSDEILSYLRCNITCVQVM